MRKFTLNCTFGSEESPLNVYIGRPKASRHPLHYQRLWLKLERGGEIPPEILRRIEELHQMTLVDKELSLEELCEEALLNNQTTRKLEL